MFQSAPGRSLVTRATSASSFGNVTRLAAVAFAVALTAAAAQVAVPLPFTSVPFVLTPLVVLLTAAALGSRLGAAAQLAYLAAGIAGLPVFAPSVTLPPGALRLFGPTGGYLLAYPVAAFVTGWLAERRWDRRYLTAAAAMIAGLLIIFAGGVLWLVAGVHLQFFAALATGFTPFIIADILKVGVAAMVLPATARLIGTGPDAENP